MMTIKLFCAAGMSTSILVNKMKDEAEKQGIAAEIDAYPESELKKHLEGLDVALLGPQVQFKLAEDKKICDEAGVPIAVIPMMDYGTMNGANVLKFAMDLKKA